jgi:histidinol-phosphatase
MPYSQELLTALKAAEKAGKLQQQCALKLQSLSIKFKADHSPVTDVDRGCEALIQEVISTKFPRDGFFGEESGVTKGKNGRRWIVDPLDGTRPYIRGIPTYSVLIALEDNNEPVVGVIHLPGLGITCYAAKGVGAFLNGKPIHVSQVDSLKAALGTSLGLVEKAHTLEGRQLCALMRACDYSYGFMDAYSYVCVACGKIDIAVSLIDKPWDRASAACIVREAGGTFSDLRGNQTIYKDTFLLSNGELHQAALGYFPHRKKRHRLEKA